MPTYPIDENHPEFKKYTEWYFDTVDKLAIFVDEIDDSMKQAVKESCKKFLLDPQSTTYRVMTINYPAKKDYLKNIVKNIIHKFNFQLKKKGYSEDAAKKITAPLYDVPLLPYAKNMPKGKPYIKNVKLRKTLHFFENLQLQIDFVEDKICYHTWFLRPFVTRILCCALFFVALRYGIGVSENLSIWLTVLIFLLRLFFPRHVSYKMYQKIHRNDNGKHSDEGLIALKETALASKSKKKMRDYLVFAKTIWNLGFSVHYYAGKDDLGNFIHRSDESAVKDWKKSIKSPIPYLNNLMLMLLADIQDVERELMHYSNNQKKVESPEINKKPEIVAEKSRTSDKMNQKATSPKDDKIKPTPKTNLETSKNVEELDDEALEKMNVMDEDEFDKMFKEAKDLFDKI